MFNTEKPIITLAIETSCDDTSISILENNKILSNVIYNQKVHEKYGGVVPEFASREHLINILPVLKYSLEKAGKTLKDIDIIAVTYCPGLLGSLIVGVSFAKGLSVALNRPLIGVNHLHGHILCHYLEINEGQEYPKFPHISLIVSGGHSQLVLVKDFFNFEIIGNTLDDAAGEAFDKVAKLLGLPYPGGPYIDKLASTGNPNAYIFSTPKVPDLNFSFSGLKTNIYYFLKKKLQENPNFIKENINDICASFQKTIIDYLIQNCIKALKKYNIKVLTIGGGVSANTELREKVKNLQNFGYKVFIPEKLLTTDNAAMIGIVGFIKYINNFIDDLNLTPLANC